MLMVDVSSVPRQPAPFVYPSVIPNIRHSMLPCLPLLGHVVFRVRFESAYSNACAEGLLIDA